MQDVSTQETMKKLAYGSLGLLIVYAVVRSLFAAAGKPFWYDELLTLTVSSQGSWKGILSALRAPLDGQPPLFYVIEAAALNLTSNEEIGLRLPSILAFACTLVCVFVYVKKRGGDLVAFLTALFLLMTVLFQLYAIEARPYSLVVTCVAFAMVCYQRAPAPKWTVLLAVTLALAQSFHYYAVFAMVPFGVAELVCTLRRGKIRWQIWTALAIGAMPVLLHWNLIATNEAYYGAHFWAKFHFYFLPHTYGDFFETNSRIGAGVAVVVISGVLGAAFWQQPATGINKESTDADLNQAALLAALAALPFIGYAVTTLMHSGLTTRYVLSTVLGLATGFGFILSKAKTGTVLLFGLFVLSAATVDEIHFWRFSHQNIQQLKTDGTAVQEFINGAGYGALPIVVAYGFTDSRLLHYAPLSLTNRFVFLTRFPPPNDPNWTDTQEKGMELLKNYMHLRIAKSSEFIAAKRNFLIYRGETQSLPSWLELQLLDEGWTLRLIASDVDRTLYLAIPKGDTAP